MKETIENQEVEFRGLTRGEVVQLKRQGIIIGNIIEISDPIERMTAQEKVIMQAVTGKKPDLDAMTPAGIYQLFLMVTTLTFLGEEALKNLSSPPENGRQDGSKTAGNASGQDSGKEGDAQN